MARDMQRKGAWVFAAAWLVLSCLAGPSNAKEQLKGHVLAQPDNAVVAERIRKEMSNPAVLRLQKLYAEAGVTTGQMERLRLMDARAFAMARFATREDIQEFHHERAAVLTSEQMKRISGMATEEFRVRLRGRTRLNQETPLTSESLSGENHDPVTSKTFVSPDDETTPTLKVVPISSPDNETSSAERPASGDKPTTSSEAQTDSDAEESLGGAASVASPNDDEAATSQTRKSGDE